VGNSNAVAALLVQKFLEARISDCLLGIPLRRRLND
jgi:hypothetical protein